MDFEIGTTRIYRCPVCGVDTPHSVKGKRGHMYGVLCTNCRCGSVVSDEDLDLYQLEWDEDLEAMLNRLLDNPFLGEDDD